MVAALTTLPVIGVPVSSKALSGVDSLYSIVQMPAGIPVATVAIGNAANAGLLALQILAISDPALREQLHRYRQGLAEMVTAKDARLQELGSSNYGAVMNLPRWLRLSLILPLLGLNLFVLRQLLLRLAPFPALFISAALIAFLLDIPRRWLQHRGVPRPLTMVLVLGLTIGVVVLSGLWLVPRLIEQLGELINAAPGWLEQAQNQLNLLQEKGLGARHPHRPQPPHRRSARPQHALGSQPESAAAGPPQRHLGHHGEQHHRAGLGGVPAPRRRKHLRRSGALDPG